MGFTKIYNGVLRRFLKNTFHIWEKLGFHAIPIHFYEPTPDLKNLDDKLWKKNSDLIGIKMNEDTQLNLLETFSKNYRKEYETFPRNRTGIQHQYYTHNTSFSTINGEILYCMIRHFKPKKVLEIGSGNSTFISAKALISNNKENYSGELVAIEPYPKQVLKQGFPGLTKLIQRNLQDVPLSEFENLKENDILFIDSSHMLKLGSDVHYEYLEILPRLNKGVIVHIHDIFLPAEYPKDWIMNQHYFWNEQYLLQSFMAFNTSFEVLWASNYMHLKHSEKLASISSSYADYAKKRNWTGPSSFWIRRCN
ncbi:MAG: class I SAM-dependent methyltransferase [Candidatus Gastranaerophilales bacterium]|nr:class I SAM-dependent methyltransferase [Candidatus Gastranaerophilales bacterium]